MTTSTKAIEQHRQTLKQSMNRKLHRNTQTCEQHPLRQGQTSAENQPNITRNTKKQTNYGTEQTNISFHETVSQRRTTRNDMPSMTKNQHIKLHRHAARKLNQPNKIANAVISKRQTPPATTHDETRNAITRSKKTSRSVRDRQRSQTRTET